MPTTEPIRMSKDVKEELKKLNYSGAQIPSGKIAGLEQVAIDLDGTDEIYVEDLQLRVEDSWWRVHHAGQTEEEADSEPAWAHHLCRRLVQNPSAA